MGRWGDGGGVVVVRLGCRGATRDIVGNAAALHFLGAGAGAVGHARHILTPAAGPAWSQGALGLSSCPPPPGQGPQQLALGPGNPMGPSMPGSPCGRAKGRGCNLSRGERGPPGRGVEGTHLSPLLSRLSGLTHVALGALKADERKRNKSRWGGRGCVWPAAWQPGRHLSPEFRKKPLSNNFPRNSISNALSHVLRGFFPLSCLYSL